MILASSSLPSLPSLRAFLAVAETQSFTRAAAGLGLTQTAVSHQIAQLEAWLGGPLFIRDRKGVALTGLGQSLLPAVETSLGRLHDALASGRRSVSQSRLTVSTTPEFGAQWLAPRLERFVAANPAISVNMILEYRRADVLAGEVDLAIWLGSGGPSLHTERLALDEEFAVSSPELAASLPKAQALLAAPLLHYEGARHTVLDWRRWYSQLFGAENESHGGDLHGQLDFDSGPVFSTFPEMLEACRRGDGFALVCTSLVADDLAAGTLVRCFVESVPSDLTYHLVLAPQWRNRPDVADFRQWILSEISGAPETPVAAAGPPCR